MADTGKRPVNEYKENIFQWVIPTALLLVYLIITLVNYSSSMEEKSRATIETSLSRVTSDLRNALNKDISNASQIAETTGVMLSNQPDVLSKDSLDLLTRAMHTGEARRAFVAKTSGDAADTDGTRYFIGDESYFVTTLTNTCSLSKIFQGMDGEFRMIVTAPITSGSEISGIVGLEYNLSNFQSLPRSGEQDGKTKHILVQKDGTIMSTIGIKEDYKGENIIEMVENSDKSSVDVQKRLNLNMNNGKSGVVDCKIFDEERTLAYQSVGLNGMYVIDVFSEEFVNMNIRKEYTSTRNVCRQIVIAMALFFTMILSINLINRAVYAKQSKELKNRAETDLLTGLLNKISTEKHIQEYLENEGHDKEGMLFVLDVDNFKRINDTMGHAFGDEVLRTLGQKIKSEFRLSDIVGRIGGDEFLVYLKNISDDETRMREAKRVTDFFKVFKAGEYVKCSATASIGVACYPADGQSFEELYHSADKAVYKAKELGKNQLVFYGSLDAEDKKDGDVTIS